MSFIRTKPQRNKHLESHELQGTLRHKKKYSSLRPSTDKDADAAIVASGHRGPVGSHHAGASGPTRHQGQNEESIESLYRSYSPLISTGSTSPAPDTGSTSRARTVSTNTSFSFTPSVTPERAVTPKTLVVKPKIVVTSEGSGRKSNVRTSTAPARRIDNASPSPLRQSVIPAEIDRGNHDEPLNENGTPLVEEPGIWGQLKLNTMRAFMPSSYTDYMEHGWVLKTAWRHLDPAWERKGKDWSANRFAESTFPISFLRNVSILPHHLSEADHSLVEFLAWV